MVVDFLFILLTRYCHLMERLQNDGLLRVFSHNLIFCRQIYLYTVTMDSTVGRKHEAVWPHTCHLGIMYDDVSS